MRFLNRELTCCNLGYVLLAALITASAGAQTTATPAASPAPATGVVYHSKESLDKIAEEVTKTSRSAPAGTAAVTLDTFPTHFTMVAVRLQSGGAELHKKAADIFVVMDGEATVITGGTIINPTGTGDEVKGTRVEGGTSQLLRKGDVIMIPANTPHQTTLAPGKTFTYYVVKVKTQ